ncbi:hypothetical protein LINGRAHAP2_LOCUS35711 [Linum grandiflorum]
MLIPISMVPEGMHHNSDFSITQVSTYKTSSSEIEAFPSSGIQKDTIRLVDLLYKYSLYIQAMTKPFLLPSIWSHCLLMKRWIRRSRLTKFHLADRLLLSRILRGFHLTLQLGTHRLLLQRK